MVRKKKVKFKTGTELHILKGEEEGGKQEEKRYVGLPWWRSG